MRLDNVLYIEEPLAKAEKGEQKSGHKYVRRMLRPNGKWHYYYEWGDFFKDFPQFAKKKGALVVASGRHDLMVKELVRQFHGMGIVDRTVQLSEELMAGMSDHGFAQIFHELQILQPMAQHVGEPLAKTAHLYKDEDDYGKESPIPLITSAGVASSRSKQFRAPLEPHNFAGDDASIFLHEITHMIDHRLSEQTKSNYSHSLIEKYRKKKWLSADASVSPPTTRAGCIIPVATDNWEDKYAKNPMARRLAVTSQEDMFNWVKHSGLATWGYGLTNPLEMFSTTSESVISVGRTEGLLKTNPLLYEWIRLAGFTNLPALPKGAIDLWATDYFDGLEKQAKAQITALKQITGEGEVASQEETRSLEKFVRDIGRGRSDLANGTNAFDALSEFGRKANKELQKALFSGVASAQYQKTIIDPTIKIMREGEFFDTHTDAIRSQTRNMEQVIKKQGVTESYFKSPYDRFYEITAPKTGFKVYVRKGPMHPENPGIQDMKLFKKLKAANPKATMNKLLSIYEEKGGALHWKVKAVYWEDGIPIDHNTPEFKLLMGDDKISKKKSGGEFVQDRYQKKAIEITTAEFTRFTGVRPWDFGSGESVKDKSGVLSYKSDNMDGTFTSAEVDVAKGTFEQDVLQALLAPAHKVVSSDDVNRAFSASYDNKMALFMPVGSKYKEPKSTKKAGEAKDKKVPLQLVMRLASRGEALPVVDSLHASLYFSGLGFRKDEVQFNISEFFHKDGTSVLDYIKPHIERTSGTDYPYEEGLPVWSKSRYTEVTVDGEGNRKEESKYKWVPASIVKKTKDTLFILQSGREAGNMAVEIPLSEVDDHLHPMRDIVGHSPHPELPTVIKRGSDYLVVPPANIEARETFISTFASSIIAVDGVTPTELVVTATGDQVLQDYKVKEGESFDADSTQLYLRADMRGMSKLYEKLGALAMVDDVAKEFKDYHEAQRKKQTATGDEGMDIEELQGYDEEADKVIPKIEGLRSVHKTKGFDITLAPHQVEAIKYMLDNDGRAMYAHYMGTGKSVEAIASCLALKERGKAKKALILTQKSVLTQFKEEAEGFNAGASLWGAQSVIGATTIDGEDVVANDDEFMHITNPAYFLANKEAFLKAGFDTIIVDESHLGIKKGGKFKETIRPADENLEAGAEVEIEESIVGANKINEAVKSIAKGSNTNIILMTGTPITESPADVVEYIDILSKTVSPFGSRETFVATYLEKDALSGKMTQLKNLGDLVGVLNDHFHVVRSTDVRGKALPQVVVDENSNPPVMQGTQLIRYLAAMKSLEGASEEAIAAMSAKSGVNIEDALSEETQKSVRLARAITGLWCFKAPDDSPTLTYEYMTQEGKKTRTATWPEKFPKKWPGKDSPESEFALWSEYIGPELLGVTPEDYVDNYAGNATGKDGKPTGRKGNVVNPSYRPRGVIVYGGRGLTTVPTRGTLESAARKLQPTFDKLLKTANKRQKQFIEGAQEALENFKAVDKFHHQVIHDIFKKLPKGLLTEAETDAIKYYAETGGGQFPSRHKVYGFDDKTRKFYDPDNMKNELLGEPKEFIEPGTEKYDFLLKYLAGGSSTTNRNAKTDNLWEKMSKLWEQGTGDESVVVFAHDILPGVYPLKGMFAAKGWDSISTALRSGKDSPTGKYYAEFMGNDKTSELQSSMFKKRPNGESEFIWKCTDAGLSEEESKQLERAYGLKATKRSSDDRYTIKLSESQQKMIRNIQTMIATDAAQVGLNWGHAKALYEYDIPPTPAGEQQRLARVARLKEELPKGSKEAKLYKEFLDSFEGMKRELIDQGNDYVTQDVVIDRLVKRMPPEDRQLLESLGLLVDVGRLKAYIPAEYERGCGVELAQKMGSVAFHSKHGALVGNLGEEILSTSNRSRLKAVEDIMSALVHKAGQTNLSWTVETATSNTKEIAETFFNKAKG